MERASKEAHDIHERKKRLEISIFIERNAKNSLLINHSRIASLENQAKMMIKRVCFISNELIVLFQFSVILKLIIIDSINDSIMIYNLMI